MTPSKNKGQGFRWATLACALILTLAPMGWPYGYYQFMRLAVTAVSIWLTLLANQEERGGWMIVGGALAILFNPILPIHLERGTWMPIDWIAAALLGFAAFKPFRS